VQAERGFACRVPRHRFVRGSRPGRPRSGSCCAVGTASPQRASWWWPRRAQADVGSCLSARPEDTASRRPPCAPGRASWSGSALS
jgi:hypothetical protein